MERPKLRRSNPFTNLRRAIPDYDAGVEERRAAWDRIDSNEDVFACEQADNLALAKVQDALYEDTKEYNSRKDCGLVGIEWVRSLITPEKEG